MIVRRADLGRRVMHLFLAIYRMLSALTIVR